MKVFDKRRSIRNNNFKRALEHNQFDLIQCYAFVLTKSICGVDL